MHSDSYHFDAHIGFQNNEPLGSRCVIFPTPDPQKPQHFCPPNTRRLFSSVTGPVFVS